MTDVTIETQPSETKLTEMGVRGWPIWQKEVSTFPWTYDAEEVCYLLEGKATVTIEDGTNYEFKAGDLVTFSKGLSCEWQIHKEVKKHYQFN